MAIKNWNDPKEYQEGYDFGLEDDSDEIMRVTVVLSYFLAEQKLKFAWMQGFRDARNEKKLFKQLAD
jgi:hypothetical protein